MNPRSAPDVAPAAQPWSRPAEPIDRVFLEELLQRHEQLAREREARLKRTLYLLPLVWLLVGAALGAIVGLAYLDFAARR